MFHSIRLCDAEPIPNILIYVSISVSATKNLSPNALIERKGSIMTLIRLGGFVVRYLGCKNKMDFILFEQITNNQ
jgi:hypothetical protein